MNPGHADYLEIVRSRLREAAENMDFEEPKHTVSVRGELTDGPIPEASFDYENFQLSCNWRDLYSAFYGEIGLAEKLSSGWVKNQESWLGGLRVQMKRGELNMEAMMMQALTGFSDMNDANVKKARRARIKLQYKRRDGIDWDDNNPDYVREEPRILKALAQERQLVNMQEFSDDEIDDDDDDDDDDNEESDAGSEDEWEDDEGSDEDKEEDDFPC